MSRLDCFFVNLYYKILRLVFNLGGKTLFGWKTVDDNLFMLVWCQQQTSYLKKKVELIIIKMII